MPQSKNRKRRIAEQRRTIMKARRRLEREEKRRRDACISEINDQNEDPEIESVGVRGGKTLNESLHEEQHQRQEEVANARTTWSISNLYTWCQCSLSQGVESAKDTIFPSRSLRRELEMAQKKMAELETELEQVKKAKRRRSKSCSNEIEEISAPAPPPAPPPPPPPVLPPPPPPSLASIPKRSSTKLKIKPQRNQPVITLEDLKSIKLKRPTDRAVKQKRRSIESCPAEQKVMQSRLRASSKQNLKRLSLNVEQSELVQRRYSLRKLEIDKSPGGTPMFPSKDYSDAGTGLAPMMTRALKRKFKTAYPLTPERSGDILSQDKGPSPSILSSSGHPPAPPNTAETSVVQNSLSSVSLLEFRDV